MKISAFDIGGSKISYALIDSDGNFLQDVQRIPTPQTADEIADILHTAVATSEPDGVAVATAGVVFENRLAGKPNNLPAGYENLDFGVLFGVPYLIENDANAAAWAEYKAGALQNTMNALMQTLGTDVGCAIIANGMLLHGKCGAAGEVRMPFSGTSLRLLAQNAHFPQTDCFEIYHQALAGHADARRIYAQWESNLLNGLQQLNQLLDVETIALSGSLSKIVNYENVNAALHTLCPFNPPLTVPAKFATDSGLIGAALLWRQQFQG